MGQNFEGINYGDRKLRDQMRTGFVDIGRRERKPAAVKAYAPPSIRVGEALVVGARLSCRCGGAQTACVVGVCVRAYLRLRQGHISYYCISYAGVEFHVFRYGEVG